MITLRSVGHGTFGPLTRLAKLFLSGNKRLSNISDAAFLGMAANKNEWQLEEVSVLQSLTTYVLASIC